MDNPDRYQMDKTDFQILSALQHDCRKSITNIADEIDSSVSTVSTRLKRMVEHGIVRFQMRMYENDIYYFASTNLKIKVTPREKLNSVVNALRAIPEVVFLVKISGAFQIEAKLVCKDQPTLDQVIRKQINEIDGIDEYRDNMYLALYKWRQPDARYNANLLGIMNED